MFEPTDQTLALVRRMDAKLDRLHTDANELRRRFQRIEVRLTSHAARLGVLTTYAGEVTRLDRRFDGQDRGLDRIKDAVVLAELSGE